MIIANPIYDVVFKYLMEDMDIARGLLSTILDEEIISLSLKPQETISETSNQSLALFRLDFSAIIKTEQGSKNVLIELQKAKSIFDIMRFRRYLGDNYRKNESVRKEGQDLDNQPLPIVTIYFLGFKLPNIEVPILKVNRVYSNAVSGEVLAIKDDFVELLTHDSFTIQIPRLETNLQTHLERVLQVFNQRYKTENEHQLDFPEESEDTLVQKIVFRLTRAMASDKLRNLMDAEDEVERVINREIRKKDVVIAEKDSLIAEKDNKLAEKDNKLAEKDNMIVEKENMLAEKDNVIVEHKHIISEKDREIQRLLDEVERLKK